MPSSNPTELSRALIDAAQQQRRLSAADWSLADDADAYAVQDGIADSLGWHIDARPQYWKSGGGSRAAITHAPLAPTGVRPTPADFAYLGLTTRGVEAEIALRLHSAVTPAQAAGLDEAGAAALVDAMAVSVEVVSTRWAEGADAPARLRLADCQSHGALALGAWLPYAPAHDWAAQAVELQLQGEAVPQQGRGGHPLGDPAAVLVAWLRHATRTGRSVPAGSIVTTGAWLVRLGLPAGTVATVRFAGLGEVQVTL